MDSEKRRGWRLSSTYQGIETAAEAAGRKVALAEAGAHVLAHVIGFQARKKFASHDLTGDAILEALGRAHASDRLTALGESLIDAADRV